MIGIFDIEKMAIIKSEGIILLAGVFLDLLWVRIGQVKLWSLYKFFKGWLASIRPWFFAKRIDDVFKSKHWLVEVKLINVKFGGRLLNNYPFNGKILFLLLFRGRLVLGVLTASAANLGIELTIDWHCKSLGALHSYELLGLLVR